MAITINPSGRDPFNNLATLQIDYSGGKIPTPNRFVSRHDINAKNKLGADIPLARSSGAVVIQEGITRTALESVLKLNGFLATMKRRMKGYIDRTSVTRPLVLVYPSISYDSSAWLDGDGKAEKFYRFFSDLSAELALDAVMLPIIKDVEAARRVVARRKQQLIPVLDLKRDIHTLSTQINRCMGNEADIPFIAFKFSPFASANLGYNMVMDNLERIHECNQATMLVEVPRNLGADRLDVSALHYGTFFFGDVVTEKYSLSMPKSSNAKKKSKGPTKQVNIFCKNDLVTTHLSRTEVNSERFDLDSEKRIFSSDPRLQELFVRVVEDRADGTDWLQDKPKSLSRVHENLQTRPEFVRLRKEIESNSAQDYLSEKRDMDKIVMQDMSGQRASVSHN